MKDKPRKTLNNLVAASIIPLASFLPIKEANAQKVPETLNPNTIYLIFQPGDFGVGIRYDRRFDKKLYKFGVYSSASRGNYMLGKGNYVNNHLKFGVGGIIYPQNEFFKVSNGYFGVGISYHNYGKKVDESGILNNQGLKPFSLDLSSGIRIDNFNFFINMDPLKWEGSIGAGISFGILSKNEFKRYKKFLAEISSK